MRLRRAAVGALATFALVITYGPDPAVAATIEGRVIHPTRPGGSSRIPVFVLCVQRDERAFERKTQTDREGRFAIEGLPDEAACLVRATYEEVSFPGGSVVFGPGQEDRRSVTFHVYDPTTEIGDARIRSVRWMIEREAATYRAVQRIVIDNPDLRVVVSGDDAAPLLRVALLEGHGEVEAPFGRLPEGAQIRDGVLELRGPIYPGERELEISYDVGDDSGRLESAVPVAAPLEEATLLLRDFGMRVDAGALHPTRPVRQKDSIYMRYVGFDLAPGVRIPLSVEPLDPPLRLRPWLHALVAASVAFGLGLLVLAPLERTPRVAEASAGEGTRSERDAIDAALQDLEFDYETGKLSAGDRDRLRADLRKEAVRAIARARRPSAPAPAPSPCACGRAPQPGDRFCAACGKPL